VRTRLVVASGIALLLIAVVAVLTLRGAGNTERTASPGTTLSPGAGPGGATARSDDSNSDPGAGSGAAGGSGGGAGGAGGAGGGSGGIRSLHLPDKVGGLTRIPTGADDLFQGEAGLLDLITRSQQIEGWGLGVYGQTADDRRLVFMVFRARSASVAGVLAEGVAGGVGSSLGGTPSPKRTITRDGVRYDCWNQASGSVCSFQSGTTVGVSFDREGDLDQLSRLTDEARRGVRD
jgi:hypothetical protein